MIVKYKNWRYITNRVYFKKVKDIIFAVFESGSKEHVINVTEIEIIN